MSANALQTLSKCLIQELIKQVSLGQGNFNGRADETSCVKKSIDAARLRETRELELSPESGAAREQTAQMITGAMKRWMLFSFWS